MSPNSADQRNSVVLRVVLAVMSMESPGGVANQIAILAIELHSRGVYPIILVRNPLVPNHVYREKLRLHNIKLFTLTDRNRQQARCLALILLRLATPVAVLDAVVRGKSLDASKKSVWGVIRRVGYLGLDAVFWLQLVRARFVEGAKIIHFRNPDGWRSVAWAKKLGFRTLYSEDTIPRPHTKHYYDGLASVMYALDAVAACSQASAESLRPYCGSGRVIEILPHVIPDPARGKQEQSIQRQEFLVGCFARLVPEKDIGTILFAVKIALREFTALRLIVSGDGPLRRDLEELTCALGISANVEFLGVITDTELSSANRNADLVVLSSLYEGMPVSLIEAMAYGKPVIATAVGGVPEVVKDGVVGFLVPPKDPEALAAAILTLARDHHLYDRMARAAREQYLSYFASERIVPQYVALYERLAR